MTWTRSRANARPVPRAVPRTARAAGLLVALAGAPAPRAAGQVGPELITTTHEISVGGQTLAYVAHAGRLPIRHNETGQALGDVFFTHYALEVEPGSAPRPLTFLWNGGPGANSVLVHLLGFGPRRIRTPDTPLDPPDCDCVLQANDGTWLGFTDLVFVDPIGTGFSRPRAKTQADGFYGAREDAAYIAEFIRLFLQRFGAWDAPLFIGGESYGTWRAAGAAKVLEEHGVRVAGVLLISGGVPVGGVEREEMRVAKLLTARTAAAFYHGRLAPELQRDLDETLAEADRWATEVYAPALARREDLHADERRRVAEGLARYTGLPPESIDAQSLVVNRQDFQRALLGDGVELARFDTRITSGAPSPPAAARAQLVGSYLREELGFDTDAAYQGLESGYRSVNDSGPASPGARWRYNHGIAGEPAPARLTAGDGPPGVRPSWLRDALEIDPEIRVYVATGHYDSLNSCALNRHVIALLGADASDNFVVACYEGGHAMYADQSVRLAMRDDVAGFVREAARGWRKEHPAPPGAADDGAAGQRTVDGDVVTTRHTLGLGPRELAYTARAGTLPIRDDETGAVRANVFFVSYSVDPGPAEPARPLLFAWNGGPGSNAGLLHMAAMGPRRLAMGDVYATADPADMTSTVDNEATWLPSADLVFVDPVGTGYSRPTKAEYGPEFYDTVGDVASLAEFIRVYRTRFDALDAPIILAGESYGALRAASVARALQRNRIDVTGLVFISGSPGLGPVSRSLRSPLLLPSLTATARYHGKLSTQVRDGGEDVVERARDWAMGPYARALSRLDQLDQGERETLRRELASWTGLPVDAIDSDSLELSGPDFSERLLLNEGRILGRYDARLSRPRNSAEGIFDPRDDASLAPLEGRISGNAPTMIRYLRDTLGYESDLYYVGPFGGAWPPPEQFRGDWMSVRWNWRPGPETPLLDALTANPALRVLHTSGTYDLVTPFGPPAFLIAGLEPELRERITVRVYEGGHSFYLDRASRRQFMEDGAELIRHAVEASRAGGMRPSGS